MGAQSVAEIGDLAMEVMMGLDRQDGFPDEVSAFDSAEFRERVS